MILPFHILTEAAMAPMQSNDALVVENENTPQNPFQNEAFSMKNFASSGPWAQAVAEDSRFPLLLAPVERLPAHHWVEDFMTRAKRKRSQYKLLVNRGLWSAAQRKLVPTVEILFTLSGAHKSPQHLLRVSICLALYLMAPLRSRTLHHLVTRLANSLPVPPAVAPAHSSAPAITTHINTIIHNQRQLFRGLRTIMDSLNIHYQDIEYEYGIYSLDGSSGSSLSSAPNNSDDDSS
jgi:hypothetical protein